MNRISVNLSHTSYEVLVERGILERLGTLSSKLCSGSKAFVICDSNTGPLFRERACASLEAAGFETHSFEFAAGERSKDVTTWVSCLEACATRGLTRDDVLVALGGGVVGDLAGFVAASYMRGCALVQVPTSLLAMVDSSVGGKVAIDLPAGKNLVGAFYQPKCVLVDVELLQTLTPELLHDSCAEIIKHALIRAPELFLELEKSPLISDPLDLELLERIIGQNIRIKRDIVQADEREGDLRQILNFGHTIGHAIEAASHYRLGHGSCVAQGMCWIARSCAKRGLCSAELCERIETVCRLQGLETHCAVSADEIIERSLLDKKRHADHINLVILRDLGEVEIVPFTLDDFADFVFAGQASVQDAQS